jgi:hypothetical protein
MAVDANVYLVFLIKVLYFNFVLNYYLPLNVMLCTAAMSCSVLSYNEAEVLSAKGRKLLSPSKRASEEEVEAAVAADLEMISSNENRNDNNNNNGDRSTGI